MIHASCRILVKFRGSQSLRVLISLYGKKVLDFQNDATVVSLYHKVSKYHSPPLNYLKNFAIMFCFILSMVFLFQHFGKRPELKSQINN